MKQRILLRTRVTREAFPFRCHSERSEESLVISGQTARQQTRNDKRFFAALRMTGFLKSLRRWVYVCGFGFALLAPFCCVHAQTFFSQNEDIIPQDLDRMYVKGLKYLVKNQKPDGSWAEQYGNEPAVVGLCWLTMLAHGETPNS